MIEILEHGIFIRARTKKDSRLLARFALANLFLMIQILFRKKKSLMDLVI